MPLHDAGDIQVLYHWHCCEHVLDPRLDNSVPSSLQVQVLQYLLDELGFLPRLDVKVSTVDGFQGQEKDVIVISTVRCTQRAISTFVQDERCAGTLQHLHRHITATTVALD